MIFTCNLNNCEKNYKTFCVTSVIVFIFQKKKKKKNSFIMQNDPPCILNENGNM